MNPFTFIEIPAQFKSRIATEKNQSSLAVAIGLATRQLDVFGYYKFVTAVSNINLLPDREERVKKEQKKSKTTSLMQKLSLASGVTLSCVFVIYAFLLTTLPSGSEIIAMQENASKTQLSLNKQKKEFQDLLKWTYASGAVNNKVLDISYTASFPRGSYILGVSHNRVGNSSMSLNVNDPELSAVIMNNLNKKFKNVQLLNIKEKGKGNNLQVSFEIK